jgi:hypothetical protein
MLIDSNNDDDDDDDNASCWLYEEECVHNDGDDEKMEYSRI